MIAPGVSVTEEILRAEGDIAILFMLYVYSGIVWPNWLGLQVLQDALRLHVKQKEELKSELDASNSKVLLL